MSPKIDIVLVNPGDRRQVYQGLGRDYSAIEPPFWIAVIAAYLRNNSFSVAIIDANAENITPSETAERINAYDPLLTLVLVYGSQPSASTQNMTIAGKICKAIKERSETKLAIGGLHSTALPQRTLEEESVDFVIEGEGICTLKSLLKALKSEKSVLAEVPGLWYREEAEIKYTLRPPLIQNLNETLPVAAWDLLPMHLYKAHNWHCFDNFTERAPYAAIYTSLGCPYNCNFCCINALFGQSGIRYRDPKIVVEEMDLLANKYGVRNIKIVDELFVLNEKHYMMIVNSLIERAHDFNIWVYARVDTVRFENLAKMKKAGINWIALGIESANPGVRDQVSKNMRIKDIKNVVCAIQDAGIRVIGNFIFGLPSDTQATMRQTLDLALDLQCEFVNFYCAMAYPGSKLYKTALREHWPMPQEWHGFSQHAYEMLPLSTKHLTAKEVLKFRDDAFHEYFSNSSYLAMLESKFGLHVRKHVEEMASVRLKRKLLETEPAQGGVL